MRKLYHFPYIIVPLTKQIHSSRYYDLYYFLINLLNKTNGESVCKYLIENVYVTKLTVGFRDDNSSEYHDKKISEGLGQIFHSLE